MGRAPCCEKNGLKKGPWTQDEDQKLIDYIKRHGHGSWRALPSRAGLLRCGKSCRLRWTNYLRPDIKRGKFSLQEEQTIIDLHAVLGNKWSAIAAHLPGRTDNEIKNTWNTHLKKRLLQMGIDPVTHRPITDLFNCSNMSYFFAPTVNHLTQWENARIEAQTRLAKEYFRRVMMGENGTSAADVVMRAWRSQFGGIDMNSATDPIWASQQLQLPYEMHLDHKASSPAQTLDQLVQAQGNPISLDMPNQNISQSILVQNQGSNYNPILFSDNNMCSLALGSSSTSNIPLMQADHPVQHLSHTASNISSLDHEFNVSTSCQNSEQAFVPSTHNFSENSAGLISGKKNSSSMVNVNSLYGSAFPPETQIGTTPTAGSSTLFDPNYEDCKDYWCNILKLTETLPNLPLGNGP